MQFAPDDNSVHGGQRLFSVPKARHILGGIANGTFYQLVKDGVIVLTKIGRRSFVTDANIDRAIAKLSGDEAG